MLNFIKFLAGGRGLRDHKGLIWSHNPFPFDYQPLIEALNWSLLNMAACEDVLVGLSDLTGSGTGLKRWQINSHSDRAARCATAGKYNSEVLETYSPSYAGAFTPNLCGAVQMSAFAH